MSGVRIFVVLALALVALAALANGQCSNAITQPGLNCNKACSVTSGTFPYPLPAGETYDSFYSWILGVLGTDGADVKSKWINPSTTDPNLYFVDGQTDCYFNVSFVYEVASYRNNMGTFTFTKGSKPTTVSGISNKRIVFEESTVDCNRNGGSCLPPGSTLTFGPFSPSQGIGFYLTQNAICGGSTVFYSIDKLNSVTSRWRSIPAANGRLVAVLRDPNTQRVYLSWEDAPTGSDSDYNDNVFSLTSNCQIDYTKIPCGSDTTTGCRNTNQQFDQTTCTCACPNVVSCVAPQVYSTDLCACTCPTTQTCTAPLTWNSAKCACECPGTKPSTTTCSGERQWNNSTASCGCQCPDPATYQCSTVTAGTRFVLDSSSCTCNCPTTPPSTCTGNFKWNSANSNCSCYCPTTPPVACSGNLKWNSSAAACACTCPPTPGQAGVTCKDSEVWDTNSCSCKCPDTAADAGKTCPNTNYLWNYGGKCACVCPSDSSAVDVNCASIGLGNTVWDTSACNCTCPTTGTCPGNKAWNYNNDPNVCGCKCPSKAPSGKECKGNFVWNSTEAECNCFCPYEPPADDPCIGNTYWNRTECDCFCPYEPPTPCPGVQVWDRDACQCVCPTDDPCLDKSTACAQYACSDSTGECDLLFLDTCASQKLQFNTTGCLAWTCDDDIGCVRKANGSCCGDYKDCVTCAKYDGCDWVNNQCMDSGQILTSPIDEADHPDCFPSTGLSAGETAGITVGIVAGVTVGVGGAAALFGAGYILYRMLNKPPPPEQLPTIENLDTEAGTDDNPLFHKNEIEMTNPMFSAGGGGGDASAMFAQGGGASAVPADLHTL